MFDKRSIRSDDLFGRVSFGGGGDSDSGGGNSAGRAAQNEAAARRNENRTSITDTHSWGAMTGGLGATTGIGATGSSIGFGNPSDPANTFNMNQTVGEPF
ncbi:hypothetical protein [Tateyamaria sp. ANG-S1]|uniref:hypothetical protein n=1 Tax=Tateyamaria sp. ANG-S1 TaxID=1577905 RepID=UPI00057CF744|nr:hypothetical protein [Tateyamaria sp. ANG-S1]KIC51558.1 hypothetical protein RA29_01800 [Tateyamaria sp. ANG-S1]